MDRKAAKKMFADPGPGLARLMDLNFRFLREIDPARLRSAAPEMPEEVWRAVLASDRAVERLSMDLSWLGGELAPVGFDSLEPRERLLLVPWEDRRRALFLFGMAVRFQAVKQCVDGREFRRLAEIAGPGARAFALSRGSLMIGRRIRDLFPDNPDLGLFERVEWAAAGAAAALLQGARPALAARSLKTVPEAFEKRIRMVRPFGEAERQLAWSGLSKVVFKEALPEWANFLS